MGNEKDILWKCLGRTLQDRPECRVSFQLTGSKGLVDGSRPAHGHTRIVLESGMETKL